MPEMITILGPTACGKTALATALAAEIGGEVISADSRQVYRGMDIGTGKDLEDYWVKGRRIPYHLIDICEPGTKYNLYRYQQDFLEAYRAVRQRGAVPILCGGTGLYIESVLRGYQLSPVPQNPALRKQLQDKSLPELTELLRQLKARNGGKMHNQTDVDSCQRAVRAIEIETYISEHPVANRTFPQIDSLIIGVAVDREVRRQRITLRLKQRLDHGLVEEIKGLLTSGISAEQLVYYGLEYKYVTEYVTGKLTYEQMFQNLEIAIHQFAKRQMTWFRGMERRGFVIHWLDAQSGMETKLQAVRDLMAHENQ